ncbi:MAG: four helix bundle protein [Brevundimonas sp.]|nr:MAG: four helix bundle protein [Brevundimonas sp.]
MNGEWRVANGETRHYRDLPVWQKAVAWVERIYKATGPWPTDERFGLTSQVRRAAVSIPSNIAEGSTRRSTGDFIRFLPSAKSSLAEAETQFILAGRLTYIDASQQTALLEAADEISRMIAGLITNLEERRS